MKIRLPAAVAAIVLLAGCSNEDLSEEALDGNVYESTEVSGHDLVPDTAITLTFEDGNLAVAAGCNTQSSSYDVVGETMKWTGEPISTLMACSDELTAQDQWLNEIFTDGVDASLDGETLKVTSGDVEIVLEAQ
jgi:heat shock protein HslJ